MDVDAPLPSTGVATDLRPLDRRVTTAWWITLGCWIAVIALAGLVVTVIVGSATPVAVAAAAGVAVAAAGAVTIPMRYARFRYAFGGQALELQRGIWWRTRAAVPYHRIQHVDIEQGPILRRLGLVALQLKTASASSIGGIPGLAADEADALREWLIARSGHADGA